MGRAREKARAKPIKDQVSQGVPATVPRVDLDPLTGWCVYWQQYHAILLSYSQRAPASVRMPCTEKHATKITLPKRTVGGDDIYLSLASSRVVSIGFCPFDSKYCGSDKKRVKHRTRARSTPRLTA